MARSTSDAFPSSNLKREDLFFKTQKIFYEKLDNAWPKLSTKWSFILAALIICLFALWINGIWMLVLISIEKQFDSSYYKKLPILQWVKLDYLVWKDLLYYVIVSTLSGVVIYFPMCGFIHWYFYINQRDRPEDWKCQPKKFLTWKDEKHEIILGSTMITLTGALSGCLNFYIASGGHSTLYYYVSDYGWLYFILSIPLLFLYTDLSLYYAHRFMHLPVVYRTVHKMHHRYKQPTPFSATAMHPLELLTYEACTFLPIFAFPIHWSVFVGNTIYMFYYSIIDHSGVKLDAFWPWQPSTTFHDNHHQYFHVNFGFNLAIWDKFHGTFRLKDKIYNENIFYGYGKSKKEATETEIKEYFQDSTEK